jgi:uncharacterized membrane protein YeaQ/YmgE (transglycosylase-associated protein family)
VTLRGRLNVTLTLSSPNFSPPGPFPDALAPVRSVPREAVRVLDFLNHTFEVDTYTLVVVGVLSGWAGVLTQHVLSKTVLALVFVPGFVFGALVANYIFDEIGFYPTGDRETNVVVACAAGIIAALLVLLIVTRFTSILTGVRVQRHQFKRY